MQLQKEKHMSKDASIVFQSLTKAAAEVMPEGTPAADLIAYTRELIAAHNQEINQPRPIMAPLETPTPTPKPPSGGGGSEVVSGRIKKIKAMAPNRTFVVIESNGEEVKGSAWNGKSGKHADALNRFQHDDQIEVSVVMSPNKSGGDPWINFENPRRPF